MPVRFFQVGYRTPAPRGNRHAGRLGHLLGRDLVANPAHAVAVGADERQTQLLLAKISEGRMLRNETPADPDSFSFRGQERFLDRRVVEIGDLSLPVLLVDEQSRSDAMRHIRFAHEHRVPLRIGVERNRDQPGVVLGVVLADRVNEAHGALATIDDGDASKALARHLIRPGTRL